MDVTRKNDALRALVGGVVIQAVRDVLCSGNRGGQCSVYSCAICRKNAWAFLESPWGQALMEHMGTDLDYIRKGVALVKEQD